MWRAATSISRRARAIVIWRTAHFLLSSPWADMGSRPKRTAREIERSAAAARARSPARELRITARGPGGEAAAMLARRGVLGAPVRLDLPFDEALSGEPFERMLTYLG